MESQRYLLLYCKPLLQLSAFFAKFNTSGRAGCPLSSIQSSGNTDDDCVVFACMAYGVKQVTSM